MERLLETEIFTINTYELTSLLNRAPQLKHLHGQVCAKDLLPEEKSLDVKAYIINTDTSDKPGEFWVAIYFRNNNEAIYFDSYGQPPLEDYILPFIQRNPDTGSTTKNCYRVHGVESVACTVSIFWINSEEDWT